MTRLAMKYGGPSDQMYVDFLSSDVGKAGYSRFFRALLALPEDRALLFHCSQGKDRTGCGAMLILYALGADRETIMADFLLTNDKHDNSDNWNNVKWRAEAMLKVTYFGTTTLLFDDGKDQILFDAHITRPSLNNTNLNLNVIICGAGFSFCQSRTEGGDAAHR